MFTLFLIFMMTKRLWVIQHKTSKLNGKFNHGISFAELASLGWCDEVCKPGKGNGYQEEDGEGGEGVGVSLVETKDSRDFRISNPTRVG